MTFFENIKLDKNSPEPLFLQLAKSLSHIIKEHYPDTPHQMPSVRKLSAALKIDRSTVDKAYSELKKSGFLEQHSPRIIHTVKIKRKRYLEALPGIGIILPDKMAALDHNDLQFIMEYFKGICDAATENNIALSMLQLPDANSRAAENASFIKEISRHYIGIIHLGDRLFNLDSPLHKLMCCQTLPQVIIAAETEYRNILQILPDESTGINELATGCRELNLQKIAAVMPFDGIKPSHVNPYFYYTALKRGEFIRDFFLKAGFSCDEKHHIFNFSNYQELLNNLRQKQAEKLLPQLYLCYNDTVALWLLQACGELGIKVPQELSIVGFDGMENPQTENLATIKLPFYDIGTRAVEELVKSYSNDTPLQKKKILIKTDFITGKTIGPKNQP
ncbi:MAG: GntR family transcriptional regulator [Lentisphaerae bacterium]|nr:GntR family transcriptional regulator [Lentisphaerota bacterium]